MRIEKLSSLKNPRVRLLRSLKDRKGRKETGLFLVEGDKMTAEALSSGFSVRCLLVRENHPLPEGLPEDLPVCVMPEEVLAAVCDTRTPQGIAAAVEMRSVPMTGEKLIALDGLQDPGNVGTIVRTADAAGFGGVLLSPDCADVFSPKTLRATMGSIFRVGLAFPASLPEELGRLREEGYSVLSSQLDGDPFYERNGVCDKLVLVVGNEGNGVSPAVRREATHHLRLPMRGGAESLNAAVAAAVMMYDLTRP